MTTKRRELCGYGYKTYSGAILTKYDVDSYNALQARINTFIDAGREAPLELLNASHKVLAEAAIRPPAAYECYQCGKCVKRLYGASRCAACNAARAGTATHFNKD